MDNFDINKVKWTTGWKNLPTAYYPIKVPGVTTIINELIPDPEMEEWIRKVGQAKVDEIMTNASYRGTAMHTFIQNFIDTLSKTK